MANLWKKGSERKDTPINQPRKKTEIQDVYDIGEELRGDEIYENQGLVQTYAGTAGRMDDFSPAEGLRSVLSSFSRNDFSDEMILLLAMVLFLVGEGPDRGCRKVRELRIRYACNFDRILGSTPLRSRDSASIRARSGTTSVNISRILTLPP
jgi:hypothetical protein